MPKPNKNLNANSRVSIHKRFISNNEVKTILQGGNDWNKPDLRFKGKTTRKSTLNGKVMYDVVLDEAPEHTMQLGESCIKYEGPVATTGVQEMDTQSTEPVLEESEDSLDDSTDEEESDEEEIDLSETGGWTEGEVFIDSRLSGSAEGYTSMNSRLNMDQHDRRFGTPLDYFLFFLPMAHLQRIVTNINIHANTCGYWLDVTLKEYLMWIALLTVMTVVKHPDRKAYWRLGSSRFFMTINFSDYMSITRFNKIMKMHTFEIPSRQAQEQDPLYQIRSSIAAFNDHMELCITPGKYLVVDESMNQWLGIGMPNLKKVPRKPHPIGQEFKTLADNHSYCILRIDTVSDPCSKEYDNEPGMKKITATVKRLVKPWFGTGRTVIADSWFGSPSMTYMLLLLGLYSIMQVVKRAYWPQGMPETNVQERVEEERGSHFTMKKDSENGKVFVCAYRDKKVKTFISSCGTTGPVDYKTVRASDGTTRTIQRPAAVDEYESHKSAVDAANNLRDNMTNYHDIITTERWEMRFLGFFLSLCEANAFSAFRVFSVDGASMRHASFKDHLAFQLLEYCNEMKSSYAATDSGNSRVLRSDVGHTLQSLTVDRNKRRRLVCKTCSANGVTGKRVGTCCSCDMDESMCFNCWHKHSLEQDRRQNYLSISL